MPKSKKSKTLKKNVSQRDNLPNDETPASASETHPAKKKVKKEGQNKKSHHAHRSLGNEDEERIVDEFFNRQSKTGIQTQKPQKVEPQPVKKDKDKTKIDAKIDTKIVAKIEQKEKIVDHEGRKKTKLFPNPQEEESRMSMAEATLLPSTRPSRHGHNYEKFSMAEDFYTEKFFDRALYDADRPEPKVEHEERKKTVRTKKKKSSKKSIPKEIEPISISTPVREEAVSDTIIHDDGSSFSSIFDSLIFPSDHDSGDNRPDMTWILGDKTDQDDNDDDMIKSKESQKPKPSSSPTNRQSSLSEIGHLLSLISNLGRFPISINVNKATGGFRCNVKKMKQTWDLILITLLLIIVLTTCSLSAWFIFTSHDDTYKDQFGKEVVVNINIETQRGEYAKFEKLLFQKHWIHITVFSLTLVIAVVGNISYLLYRKEIANYLNQVGESLEQLDLTITSQTMKYLHIFISTLDAIVLTCLVSIDVHDSKDYRTFQEKLGFKEAMQFETILFLRWATSDAFLRTETLNVMVYIMLIFQIYVYFVVRNHLLFVIVICQSITSSAKGWNDRISCFFESVLARKQKSINRDALIPEILLKEHHLITKLVRGISNAFTPILMTFFTTRLLCICCELFFASAAMLFDLEVKDVEKLEKINGTNVYYNPTDASITFKSIYFLVSTILGLFIVVASIATVGETIMNGFEPVRRYGLLLSKNLKERKFVMSLMMSFNAKKPHVVKPGLWFRADKGLFLSIIGTSLLLFSIMIQFTVVNLVETAIVLPCPYDPGALCVKNDVTNTVTGDIKTKLENPVPFPLPIPKNPPLLTTTTTTLAPILPPCTRSKSSKFSNHQTSSFVDNTRKCGLFCPYTRIYRMIPFNKDGEPQLSVMISPWLDNSRKTLLLDCIAKPYANFKNLPHIYDCFGNCYNNVDSFGRYAMTLISPTPTKTPQYEYFPDYMDSASRCFKENVQPLEICGIPYTYLRTVRNYLDNKLDAVSANAELLKFDKNALFSGSRYPVICNKTNHSLADPSKMEGLVYNFRYNGSTDILRPIPFGYLYKSPKDPQGIRIHFEHSGKIWDATKQTFVDETEEQLIKRLFGHAYDYIHPVFTTDKTTQDKHSYGFYDCFGAPLDQFDDCGGLPFTRKDTETQQFQRPKLINSNGDFGGNKKYQCWESWIPGYECGVPKSSGMIGEVCEAWKDYVAKHQA